jgi:hypothetical protein
VARLCGITAEEFKRQRGEKRAVDWKTHADQMALGIAQGDVFPIIYSWKIALFEPLPRFYREGDEA